MSALGFLGNLGKSFSAPTFQSPLHKVTGIEPFTGESTAWNRPTLCGTKCTCEASNNQLDRSAPTVGYEPRHNIAEPRSAGFTPIR